MSLLLVGLGGLGVSLLVVADDVAGVPRCGGAAAAPERHVAPLVQSPAHRLGRHLWVFPPAAAPCAWRRIRSNGDLFAATVYVPEAFPYSMMKLSAFADRKNDAGKDLGRHHTLDAYAIVGMMSEREYDRALACARSRRRSSAGRPPWACSECARTSCFARTSGSPSSSLYSERSSPPEPAYGREIDGGETGRQPSP